MGQVHSCGFLTSEIFFEIERVREAASKGNAEYANSHLSIVEKELQMMSIHCEIADISTEKDHLLNVRNGIKDKQWELVKSESLAFEKLLIEKQARNHNNGEDPLDVIPSRVYDALK